MARLLFVHAHPDDETLWTGVAMAHHVSASDEVHVLTCTLGEEGEVIPDDLAHLELPAGEPRPDDIDDPLAKVRREELRAAMAATGVTTSVILGDDEFTAVTADSDVTPRRYRDSGMAGTPSAAHPRAFVGGDLDEQSDAVAAYIDALAPDVVVTYDEHGGYGHPDHVRTHDVVVAALAKTTVHPTAYRTQTPRSWAQEDRAWLQSTCSAEFLHETGFVVPSPDDAYPPSVVDDDAVTHAVIDDAAVTTQIKALRAHRTQVSVADEVYALSNHVAARLSGREGYARLDAPPGRAVTPAGTANSTGTANPADTANQTAGTSSNARRQGLLA